MGGSLTACWANGPRDTAGGLISDFHQGRLGSIHALSKRSSGAMDAILPDGDGSLVGLLLSAGGRVCLVLEALPRPRPLARLLESLGLLVPGPSSAESKSLVARKIRRCSVILRPHSASSGVSTFSSAASSSDRVSRVGMTPGRLREASSSKGLREGASW